MFFLSRLKPADQISDTELVDQLLAGVPGAFDRFYKRYDRLIYRCIVSRCATGEAADLFQGFFERLVAQNYRLLRMWQRETPISLYLAKVVRNFVIDAQRSRRWRERSAGGLVELAPMQDATRNDTAEDLTLPLELKNLRRAAIGAWSKLEVRDRSLLCNKLHREINTEELANRAGLSSGAARTALSRAQSRLLANLKAAVPEYFSG